MKLQARETKASWSSGAAFPSDRESFEVVEQRKGLLDDITELAQALDIWGAPAGDDRQDPAFSQFTTVGVGVVALVAEQSLGAVKPAVRPSTWIS
ncbi:hypothetical protein ACFW2I_14850 [Streptomyces nigra]|uniref:hypothetical protein n=1 Tax=Streptomyces nigra TaxID=1827580 RepID=UPI0036916384